MRLVRIVEQQSGPGYGQYACAGCRQKHALVPVAGRGSRLDIDVMRAAAQEALERDGGPLPRFEELAEATQRLRSHLVVLLPAVEVLAGRTGAGSDGCRRSALETVVAARAVVAASPGHGLVSAVRHARSLARELQALCGHYEALAGPAVEGAT